MEASEDIGGLKLTLGVYLLIFGMKLAVYFLSGVMTLLAEAMHTLSDIIISGFLLIATLYARRKPDEIHMFGYGRAQNVAALVAATLFISFTSYKLYEEAIPRLFVSEQVVHRNLPLVLGVLAASMLIAAAPLVKLLRQKKRGAAARAQLMELINDELGLIAALVGTLFIMGGWPLADPLASIVVATIIAVNAVGLYRENLSFLLGRSPGSEYLAKVRHAASSVRGVLDVHALRAEFIGPDVIHAGMHIVVRPELTVQEANHITEEVRRRIHEGTNSGYCFIQVEAGEPGETPA